MATNLVSSVMQFLTPDMVARIARTLGIDPDVAQKVVSAAVPSILASFAGLAAKPAGAQQLSETVQQQRPDMLSQITSLIGGPDQKAIADTGSGLLSTLLGGSGLNGLVSAMSIFAGINQNASKSVLGLIAPMVVGALGQQQRSGGLDANGLANLLSSQKDQITAAMPSGLANMVGARGMLDALDGSLRRGADTASAAAGRMASTMSDTARGAGQVGYGAARRPLTASWPLWILGLVVLAGLGWYFLGEREQQLVEQTRGLINKATEDVATKTPNPADVSADLTSSVDTVRIPIPPLREPLCPNCSKRPRNWTGSTAWRRNFRRVRARNSLLWSKHRCRRSTASATELYQTRRLLGWPSLQSTRCAQSCNRWHRPDSASERSAPINEAHRILVVPEV
jgi:hypothetical protein